MTLEGEAATDARWGLALSGGGFRAVLYHCGALIRMNELGLLPRLDRITSVSGGSIVAGRLATAWERLDFDGAGSADNIAPEVIDPLRAFCRQDLDVRSIVAQLLPFGRNAVTTLIAAYDELFESRRLNDVPERPHFIFKSTNLRTGRSVRFSHRRVADYRLGEIRDTSLFSLAEAVAASSAFPPFLSPVTLKVARGAWSDLPGADLFGDTQLSGALHLTDGGVYDNMGLNRINRFGTILCSDAGAPFRIGPMQRALSPRQVLRALDIATDQARGLRKQDLIRRARSGTQTVGYWSIDQDATDAPPAGTLPRDAEIVRGFASMRTRLNRFDEGEQGRLINWGYASSDERIRRYVLPDAAPPAGLPEPDWPLTP